MQLRIQQENAGHHGVEQFGAVDSYGVDLELSRQAGHPLAANFGLFVQWRLRRQRRGLTHEKGDAVAGLRLWRPAHMCRDPGAAEQTTRRSAENPAVCRSSAR